MPTTCCRGAAGNRGRGGRGDKSRRGFLLDLAGAETNRHLFRADASRPTSRVHEYGSGRPRSVLIEISAGYFRVKTRPNPKEIPGVSGPSVGQSGFAMEIRQGRKKSVPNR